MASLRERVDLLATKETQLAEIKVMLRALEPGFGVRFVSDEDMVTPLAWAFVGVVIGLQVYALKVLAVDPALSSMTAFAGGV